jgi:hypothetical protein
VIEIATNSVRAQEKGEQAKFFKNIAQIVKQELDSQKGFVFIALLRIFNRSR